MHERQAGIALSLLLVLSIFLIDESFADKDEDKREKIDKKNWDDSDKFKKWKNDNSKHDDDDDGYKRLNINELQKQIIDLQNQIKNIIRGIIIWEDIEGIPEDIADGDNDILGKLSCEINQFPVFTGDTWNCENTIPNEDTLSKLNCDTNEIAKWNGKEWQCTIDVAFSASPIFFHHFRVNGGEVAWGGITETSAVDLDKISIVFPTSGFLSNLYAKLGDSGDLTSPRNGEQYTMTIIKNKIEETELKCNITELENFCSSEKIKIPINAGDEILIKASSSMNAPFAVIKTSVFFEGS